MKYILVTLLFVCAAEAFQSQVHLPENTVRNKLTELDRYLQGKYFFYETFYQSSIDRNVSN